MKDKDLSKYYNQTYKDIEDCIKNLLSEKRANSTLSWQDISDIVKTKYGVVHSRKWYVTHYGTETIPDDIDDKILELQKLKVKISDERIQNNAFVRKIAREEELKDILKDACSKITPLALTPLSSTPENKKKEGVLVISDWHYGFDFSIPFNTYNPEICKERVKKLLQETIKISKKEGITTLHVVNLSDMIAGLIHLGIRLQSNIDVVEQIMRVSELVADFLIQLTPYFNKIEYHSTSDNHSRIDPKKNDAVDSEALYRLTDWWVQERLKNYKNFKFHEKNTFGADIVTFSVLGHRIGAVHGDRDAPSSAMIDLSWYTKRFYELILMAHFHHFQANEDSNTTLICNGSLVGVDPYAHSLRVRSKPSQTLIIVSEDTVTDCIYKIDLDSYENYEDEE